MSAPGQVSIFPKYKKYENVLCVTLCCVCVCKRDRVACDEGGGS